MCGTLKESHARHQGCRAELATPVLRYGARIGFEVGKGSPCRFRIKDLNACGMMHRCNFVFVVRNAGLANIAEHMSGGVQHQDRSCWSSRSSSPPSTQPLYQAETSGNRVRERPPARRGAP